MSAAMRWGLIVVGLLVGNVIAMVVLAMMAHSEPPQVVANYYERAAHFDDTMAAQAASRALGWRATVTVAHDGVMVVLVDRAGAPISDAHVVASGAARAGYGDHYELVLVASGPGHYRASYAARLGMHDLVVRADRGADHFVESFTIERENELAGGLGEREGGR